MPRNVCCLIVLLASAGGAARAAAPPTTQPRTCVLSLAEAVRLALHQQSVRSGAHPGCSRLEVQRDVAQLLMDVELAYWNLYGVRWTLDSRDQGLHFARESFRLTRERHEAGCATLADLAQARAQYEQFRAQRVQALDMVQDREQQLRALLGMTVEDGRRLVPSDSPVIKPCQPEWKLALKEALANQPELHLAREEVRRAKLNLARKMEKLKDQESKAQRLLARHYRQISITCETIRAQRAQREAFGEQLRARKQEFLTGRGTLDILLEAQRFWADALNLEYQAIAAYNNSLAGFAFAKGAILQRHHVVIRENTSGAHAELGGAKKD